MRSRSNTLFCLLLTSSALLFAWSADAFVQPHRPTAAREQQQQQRRSAGFLPSRGSSGSSVVVAFAVRRDGRDRVVVVDDDNDDQVATIPPISPDMVSLAAKAVPGVVAAWLASAQGAWAAGPDWGIFEGRTGSLLHPVTMASLLLFSIYTGLLGFQWRRQRTMGDEISALKKSLPAGIQGSVADALKEAKAAESVDAALVNTLEAALPIEQEIADLQKERKQLAEAGPRDKHFSQGALLAFVGTAFAIEVGNTLAIRCYRHFRVARSSFLKKNCFF